MSAPELLPYTLATWVFTLHVAGVEAQDEAVRDACRRILAATDAATGNPASEALVAAIKKHGTDGEPDAIARAAQALYGDRIKRDLGEGDREVRTARIRKYQFASQLPWLARVWERANGQVRPEWLLVERVTDEVTAADPNPWNEVDETRHLPVQDFHVLWELDGCSNVYISV